MKMQIHIIKSVCALYFAAQTSFCYATEDEKDVSQIIMQPEPIEVVLLCPEGSKHEGELVPKWVTTEEATEYFCNDTYEDTEIGE